MKRLPKHLHLTLSAIVVCLAALVYGANPGKLLPLIFDFRVENLELKNIFRAVMGLYLAFGAYWFLGVRQPVYWRSATISNILFMGGLGAGRLISLLLDGVSPQYTVGMILELMMMGWGIYNIKYEEELS